MDLVGAPGAATATEQTLAQVLQNLGFEADFSFQDRVGQGNLATGDPAFTTFSIEGRAVGPAGSTLDAALYFVSASLRNVNPDKFNEDICVPRSKVPEMIRKVDAIADKYQIPIVNFGHAGDGNIHVNIMVNKKVSGDIMKAEGAIKDVFKAALELGGTMSGEHGVGIAKAPYIPLEITPVAAEYMKAIKKALDPNNILNPGKIFLDEDQRGLEAGD